MSATSPLASVAESLRVQHPLAPTSRPRPDTISGPAIVGDEPQPPYTFGDHDRLDELWVQCEEGWGYACDRLFEEAPLASEYERFGVSCGERPSVLHCQMELDAQPEEPAVYEWPLPQTYPDPVVSRVPDS